MLSGKKQIISIVSSIIIIASAINVSTEGAESAIATNVSGGEIHTLVLTESKSVWGCGDNSYYQLGINNDHDEWTLIRVHGLYDVGYLQDIDDIDGGWKHSLALNSG
jgi:alpha-tubulin suppressor-like RCC1 family protein